MHYFFIRYNPSIFARPLNSFLHYLSGSIVLHQMSKSPLSFTGVNVLHNPEGLSANCQNPSLRVDSRSQKALSLANRGMDNIRD